MKGYTSDKIRNVALVGHGGCGKTTFLENCLFETKVINRAGRVEDGNTVSDYDKMEIDKGYSINTSIIPVEWNDVKINFIDTPGFFDFVGEMNSALMAADSAIIMVDAGSGIQVGTEKAWAACRNLNKPAMFMVSKRDKDDVSIESVYEALQAKFGTSLVPFAYPLEEDMKDALKEAVAETDEQLMEKYFEEGDFSDEEFETGLNKGIAIGGINPMFTYNAAAGKGVAYVLDIVSKYAPKPMEYAGYHGVDSSGAEVVVQPKGNGPASAFVFKTLVDPFVGKISILKVITGKLSSGTELYNPRREKPEKLGKMFFLRGKTQMETPVAEAGDIVAVAKLQYTLTSDTLCDKNNIVIYDAITVPQPSLYMAVEPKEKGDEEKIGTGLNRLKEEDPSFTVIRDAETKQTLIAAQGEIQLGIITNKLKDRFGADVKPVKRRIPYRETIKGSSDVQGKHKKQSGGAGQYGDVHIRFSPSPDHVLDFSEALFGGSVPKNYVPAVEKGIRDGMEKGPLAGYPVVNIKAVFYDGSYHDVDSNEMAFKIAASLAFKKGIIEAKPILLEPIMHIEVLIPEEFMGDVMGDMNKRRAKILGMEPQDGGMQKLMAEAPMAEILDYAIALRSMTQAKGSFTQKFGRYEEVPQHLAEKVIAEANADKE